jgi:hypothetical protein
MKVIQIEHSKLAELVSVFLEITKGFAVLAGTVLLLASACHMEVVGTAKYAPDFFRVNIKIREMLTSGVRVLHGIPFLIGGPNNTAAIRTMAEISQWVTSILSAKQDITAPRALWATLISTRDTCTMGNHAIRLPLSLHKLEMGTYTSGGSATIQLLPP